VKTLFVYFRSKEDLAFADTGLIDAILTALRETGPGSGGTGSGTGGTAPALRLRAIALIGMVRTLTAPRPAR
jgi:hypothetical protein